MYQDKKESLRVKGEREVVVAFAKEKPNAFVGKKKKKKQTVQTVVNTRTRFCEGSWKVTTQEKTKQRVAFSTKLL